MSDFNAPMVVVYSSLNCSHLFVSAEMESSEAYPTQVIYYCPVCKKQHSFNAKASYIINSPMRQYSFEQYCKQVGISDFNVYVI